MGENLIITENLDRVIRTRRSVRQFTEEIPSKDSILQIVEAGRLAPYAGLAHHGTDDFRKFYVISKDSKEINVIKSLIIEAVRSKMVELEKENNPKHEPMLNGMRMLIKNGPPIGKAPWLIIAAERRGFPSREEQAIAYCMENMWLKATSLGLGIQLVSAISDLNYNSQFSELLGLQQGEFCFDAFSIGYPVKAFSETPRKEPVLSVTWFE